MPSTLAISSFDKLVIWSSVSFVESSILGAVARLPMPACTAAGCNRESAAPRFAPDSPPVGLGNRNAPVDTRLERADKRGAADSLLQPAAVQAGMGNRATAPKVDESTKLSDDQIANLSKDEMAKVLGIG